MSVSGVAPFCRAKTSWIDKYHVYSGKFCRQRESERRDKVASVRENSKSCDNNQDKTHAPAPDSPGETPHTPYRRRTRSASAALPPRTVNDTRDHVYAAADVPEVFQQVDVIASVETSNAELMEGRRIVHWGVLLRWLNDGCRSCRMGPLPLRLDNCIGEIRYGLGSLLKVRCELCGSVNNVPTDSQHRLTGETGMPIWDVNTKAAAAIYDAGIGITKLNRVLSALNLPLVNHVAMKHREAEVGSSLVSVVEQSCSTAAEDEKQRSPDSGIAVSYDAGWQRRSTGRAYNSLSGHGALIGVRTGKVLKFSHRSKSCRVCERAKGRKKLPNPHDCCKNWSGSAKAMEPSMAIQMIEELRKDGIKVSSVAMDEDATTMARIHAEIDSTITKSTDKNHLVKSFVSKLYQVQKSNKAMTYNIIKYFRRMFTLAIHQNQGHPEILKKRLDAIPHHAFMDHSKCDLSWCDAASMSDQTRYRYKGLPRGLHNDSLKNDVISVFSTYSSQAEKLSTLGSSQANESLNNSIAQKAPKNVHYSSSSSFKHRLSAAVAEKNEGSSYMVQLNNKMLLSPGMFTMKLTQKLDKARQKQHAVSTTVPFKRRRKQKKESRMSSQKSAEVREGPTYETSVSLTAPRDLSSIPAPLAPPTPSPVADKRQQLVYLIWRQLI